MTPSTRLSAARSVGVRKHPGVIRRDDDADLVLRAETRHRAQFDRLEPMAERLDRIGRLRAVELPLDHAAGEIVYRARRVTVGAQLDVLRTHRHHDGVAGLALDRRADLDRLAARRLDRRSEEHTSELQ